LIKRHSYLGNQQKSSTSLLNRATSLRKCHPGENKPMNVVGRSIDTFLGETPGKTAVGKYKIKFMAFQNLWVRSGILIEEMKNILS